VAEGDIFSIDDFSRGLDNRRSPLTAPGGSLRILENAVINQGGEIEKRLAFVKMGTISVNLGITYMFGQGSSLHFFYLVGATFSIDWLQALPPGVSYQVHGLIPPSGDAIVKLTDCEAFNDKFQVSGLGASGTTYVWYNGSLLTEVGVDVLSHGSYSRTYKTKMYRTDGIYLRFSGVNDPLVTDPSSTTNPGAGFINMAINDPDGETLEAMEIYYNNMAVFARLVTQMWSLDPDPNNDAIGQLIRIGTVAPQSVLQFGTGDVLFLSDSGVRSLKALNINLTAASVSDVGSAVDPLITAAIRSYPNETAAACAVVQPISGRYWLHLNRVIYALSYFPAGNITAWSTFPIDFFVEEFARVENYVFARDSNNNVYLYGGSDGVTYDPAMLVRVRTPHHAASKPTTNKRVQSIDAVCTGAWSISIGMLPNETDLFELCANTVDTTLGGMSIPFAGYGTHIGVHMEHQGPGPATLSALYFNLQEALTK
jgi:hypothetical protein